MTKFLTSYSQLVGLFSEDLQCVDRVIAQNLASEVDLIDQISDHIIYAGGKRLRPILLLLVAKALGHQVLFHYEMAAVIEFIHTATLLHDDVVDHSDMRRGKETANAQFGNAAAILVGDFLYTRAFQMMVDIGNMEILSLMADAVNIISRGEVLQLVHIKDKVFDELSYTKIIQYKTAQLFQAATQTGAILAGADPFMREKASQFGREIGMAFQLRDDWLDYASDDESIGKRVGNDLREGKMTLPLILLSQSQKPGHQKLVRQLLQASDKFPLFEEICWALNESGALEQTLIRAKEAAGRAEEALWNFPESMYKVSLTKLCDYAIARKI